MAINTNTKQKDTSLMPENKLAEYSIDYRNNTYSVQKGSSFRGNSQNKKSVKVVAKSRTLQKYEINNKPKLNTKNHSARTPLKKPLLNHTKHKINNKPKLNSKYKIILRKIALSVSLLLLTIVGLVIILSKFSSIKEIPASLNVANPAQEINYSEFLAPITMHDPEPFESPDKADTQMKISSSIWRCVMKNGTKKYNNYDERGFSLMPVKDVSDACCELFGPNSNVNFKERTFGPFYTLDAGEENFHISAISNANCYVPYIEDFKENGNTLELNIGYVLREDPFFSRENENPKEPSFKKHMVYTLKKNENTKEYFVQKICRMN